MQQYVIFRRNAWRTGEALEAATARSNAVADVHMPDEVRWIRSYVVDEGVGTVGTVDIYEATCPEAIRRHATFADLPLDEVAPLAGVVAR
jgi:hypothetical protein